MSSNRQENRADVRRASRYEEEAGKIGSLISRGDGLGRQ